MLKAYRLLSTYAAEPLLLTRTRIFFALLVPGVLATEPHFPPIEIGEQWRLASSTLRASFGFSMGGILH